MNRCLFWVWFQFEQDEYWGFTFTTEAPLQYTWRLTKSRSFVDQGSFIGKGAIFIGEGAPEMLRLVVVKNSSNAIIMLLQGWVDIQFLFILFDMLQRPMDYTYYGYPRIIQPIKKTQRTDVEHKEASLAVSSHGTSSNPCESKAEGGGSGGGSGSAGSGSGDDNGSYSGGSGSGGGSGGGGGGGGGSDSGVGGGSDSYGGVSGGSGSGGSGGSGSGCGDDNGSYGGGSGSGGGGNSGSCGGVGAGSGSGGGGGGDSGSYGGLGGDSGDGKMKPLWAPGTGSVAQSNVNKTQQATEPLGVASPPTASAPSTPPRVPLNVNSTTKASTPLPATNPTPSSALQHQTHDTNSGRSVAPPRLEHSTTAVEASESRQPGMVHWHSFEEESDDDIGPSDLGIPEHVVGLVSPISTEEAKGVRYKTTLSSISSPGSPH